MAGAELHDQIRGDGETRGEELGWQRVQQNPPTCSSSPRSLHSPTARSRNCPPHLLLTLRNRLASSSLQFQIRLVRKMDFQTAVPWLVQSPDSTELLSWPSAHAPNTAPLPPSAQHCACCPVSPRSTELWHTMPKSSCLPVPAAEPTPSAAQGAALRALPPDRAVTPSPRLFSLLYTGIVTDLFLLKSPMSRCRSIKTDLKFCSSAGASQAGENRL